MKILFFSLFVSAQIFAPAYASSNSDAVRDAYKARVDAFLIRGLSGAILDRNLQSEKIFLGDARDENDLFEIGSISKSFAGIAAALFALDKQLDLEAPISKYVEELKDSAFMKDVTAQQLATHLARLPDAFPTGENYGEAELIDYLKKYTPDAKLFPQGKRSYSNVGFATLGLVLSRIAKKKYTDIIREQWFSKMTSSGFITAKVPTLLPGYDVVLRPGVFTTESDLACASGGIYSNLRDMSVFLEANFNPPKTRLGDAIRLSHKLGLGWDSDPSAPVTWKNGAMIAGYSTYIAFDQKAATIILTNSYNLPIAMDFGAIAMGSQNLSIHSPQLAKIDQQVIKNFAGEYLTVDGQVRVQISAFENDFLKIEESSANETLGARLLPYKKDVFLVDDGAKFADVVSQGPDSNLVYQYYKESDSNGKPVYVTLPLLRAASKNNQ